jgi:ABC-type lipoprotein release transport system permease subunit
MTAAVVVLGGTAIVAALLPARRAVRIDPARVLRHS